MTQEQIDQIRQDIGEELCTYCLWPFKEEPRMYPETLCEGRYCENACKAFLKENGQYFDKEV